MKRVADDGQELPVEKYNPDDVSISENTAPKKGNKSSSRKGSKDSLKGSKDNLKNSRGSNKSLKVVEGDKTSNDLIEKKTSEAELKSAMLDPQHRGLKKGMSVSFRGSSVEKLETEGKANGEGKVYTKRRQTRRKLARSPRRTSPRQDKSWSRCSRRKRKLRASLKTSPPKQKLQ